MILNFARTISRYSIPVIVQDFISESDSGGKYQAVYASGTCMMEPVPMTKETLKYMPDGTYTMDDCKFLQVGSGVHPQRSVIEYNGKEYRVSDVKDRSYEGNFTEYYCKLVRNGDPL